MSDNGRRRQNGRPPHTPLNTDDSLLDIELWDDDLEDLLVDDSEPMPPVDDEAVMAQFLQDMEPEGDWSGPPQGLSEPAVRLDEREGGWDSMEAPRVNARQSQSTPLSSGWQAAERRETQALLNTLAHMLASATNVTQSMGLAAAMAPVALRTQPQVYRALWPALPALTHETVRTVHSWYRQDANRRFGEQLPQLLTAVTFELGRAVVQERPLSAKFVKHLFKRQLSALQSTKRRPQDKQYPRQRRRNRREMW